MHTNDSWARETPPDPAVTPGRANAGFFAHHGPWAPGVRLFRRLQFGAKALMISAVFALTSLCTLGWMLWQQSEQAMQDRLDATRQHVEVAQGVLTWAHAQEQAGALRREEAQTVARRLIATLRYDTREYFWINDMAPRMVMHAARPELDGQDLSTMKDPNGLFIFQAFVDQVRREGKGFVAYQWPRPGSDRPVDKVSYVIGFEPWGWVLGSGVYVDDIHEQVAATAQVLLGVLVVASAVVAYLFLCFYKVMDGGLRETRRHLRAMTDGNLTTTPSPWGRDEAAELMLDLRAMQESLRLVVTQVRHASDGILGASTDIASGANDLSARTEQTAANLQESAASMEELSASVQATFGSTAEATQTARHNAEMAEEGGRLMGDVVAQMETIRVSSARIGEIIGTVDGIAFQTNILALNAAVESARAGEHGRGFAVVASEVRKLAQLSAASAREIRQLVGTTVHQIETGTVTVRSAGNSIAAIVDGSQALNRLLDSVVDSAREQSNGLAQVTQAVHELDRMTQQNAAMVEESAAAAASMNEQALDLKREVSAFRL